MLVKNLGSLIKGLDKAFTHGLKYVISFDWTNTHTVTHIVSHSHTHPQPQPHIPTVTHTHSSILTHRLSHTLTYTLTFSNALTHIHSHTFIYSYVFSHTCTLTHTDTHTVMAFPGSSLTSPQLPGAAPEHWYVPVQAFTDLSLANSQDSSLCRSLSQIKYRDPSFYLTQPIHSPEYAPCCPIRSFT